MWQLPAGGKEKDKKQKLQMVVDNLTETQQKEASQEMVLIAKGYVAWNGVGLDVFTKQKNDFLEKFKNKVLKRPATATPAATPVAEPVAEPAAAAAAAAAATAATEASDSDESMSKFMIPPCILDQTESFLDSHSTE